eukprot:205557-Pyramimonas_sp.AAC.1
MASLSTQLRGVFRAAPSSLIAELGAVLARNDAWSPRGAKPAHEAAPTNGRSGFAEASEERR